MDGTMKKLSLKLIIIVLFIFIFYLHFNCPAKKCHKNLNRDLLLELNKVFKPKKLYPIDRERIWNQSMIETQKLRNLTLTQFCNSVNYEEKKLTMQEIVTWIPDHRVFECRVAKTGTKLILYQPIAEFLLF